MKPVTRWRVIGNAIGEAAADLRGSDYTTLGTVARGEAIEKALRRQGLVIVEETRLPPGPDGAVDPEAMLNEAALADALEWINDARFDACLVVEATISCPLVDHEDEEIDVSIALEQDGKPLAAAIFNAHRERTAENADRAIP